MFLDVGSVTSVVNSLEMIMVASKAFKNLVVRTWMDIVHHTGDNQSRVSFAASREEPAIAV